MKRKLLALVFLLAFAITPFLAFGAPTAEAVVVTLTTPGTCVEGPDAALGGAVTAFTNVTAHTLPPVDLDFSSTPCP